MEKEIGYKSKDRNWSGRLSEEVRHRSSAEAVWRLSSWVVGLVFFPSTLIFWFSMRSGPDI